MAVPEKTPNRAFGRFAMSAMSAALVLLAVSCGACKSGSPASKPATATTRPQNAQSASKPAKSEAVRRAISLKNLGDTVLCTVTGESFAIDSSSCAAEYRGRSYYFPDEASLKAFLASPGEYELDPSVEPASASK